MGTFDRLFNGINRSDASCVKWKREGGHISGELNGHTILISIGRSPSLKIDDGKWQSLRSGNQMFLKAQSVGIVERLEQKGE